MTFVNTLHDLAIRPYPPVQLIQHVGEFGMPQFTVFGRARLRPSR